MRTIVRSKIALLFMALGLLVAIPAVAFANDILRDNLTNNGGSGINLGTIAPGTSATGQLTTLSLECVSGGNVRHVANDPTTGKVAFVVTKTLATGSAGDVSELTSVTPDLSVPSTWPADGQACDANDTMQTGTVDVSVSVPEGADAGQRTITVKLDTADANVVNFPVTYTVSGSGGGGTGGDPCAGVTVADPTFDYDPDGANDWYKTIPTVSASSTTPGTTTTYSLTQNGTFGAAPVLSEGTTTVYAKATDSNGCSSNVVSQTYRVDPTPPALNISDPNGTTTLFDVCSLMAGSGPLRPTFAPTDATSGLDGTEDDSWSTPPPEFGGIGTYTYSAHATDFASNLSSETRTYGVVPDLNYTDTVGPFSGILQPVNIGSPPRSSFKLGSTIPIKFRMMCGTTPVTGLKVSLYLSRVDGTADPVNEAVATTTGTTGTLFRYDAASGQYIFNLATKGDYVDPAGQTMQFGQGTWYLSLLFGGTTQKVQVAAIDLRK